MSIARSAGAVVFLLALVAVAAFIWTRAAGVSRSSQDFPDGIAMLCSDDACGTAFNTTLHEIARIREADDEAAVPCPECGGPSVRAIVCPSCKASFPATRSRGVRAPACPHCAGKLPSLTGSE